MRRKVVSDHYDEDEKHEEQHSLMINMNKSSTNGISCPELLELNPTKFGHAYKKNSSLLAYFFPCWFPPYKPRFLVLIGNFLYRYSSEHSDSVKGVPIPIDGVTVKSLGECSFEVATIRKTYTIKVSSADEVAQWVDAIRQRKLAAIKESMGHAHVDPSIKRINRVAAFLFDRRLQGDRDLAGSSVKNPMDGMHAPF